MNGIDLDWVTRNEITVNYIYFEVKLQFIMMFIHQIFFQYLRFNHWTVKCYCDIYFEVKPGDTEGSEG